MNPTKVKLNQEARMSLKKGVDLVADAVKVSLGAEGRNVIIPHPHIPGAYIITKDGVSIARSIVPKDVNTAIGAALIKEAAGKTNSEAGDGTTSSTVLAQAIFNAGLELINEGVSAVQLKKGIDRAIKDIVTYLKDESQAVKKKSNNLRDIATISANGDVELGEHISRAFSKIGKHGKVITEESDTADTHIKLYEGVTLERGWTSPIFKTDGKRDVCEMEDPLIMLHRGKIEKGDDIVDLFDQVFAHPDGRLLILTDDIDPFVHSVISQNVKQKHIHNKICVVKLPQILKIHKDLLDDIAQLTGAVIISEELGTRISLENLGRGSKCVVNDRETIIVGDQENIKDLVKEIEEKIEATDNKHDKEEQQERLARLTGGIATLYVGAKTDSELKERMDRVEDSINATRSALEEGILPGGGIALVNAANELTSDGDLNDASDMEIGYELVISACYTPAMQICKNADIEFVSIKKDHGINVKTGEQVDMKEAGIIDPTKVIRCAIENAGSVAGLFLTTEGVVAQIPQ